MPGDFRISSKKFLLTYPQCPVDKHVALHQLVTLLNRYTPHIRIARELHEDGQPHLHAVIFLESKLNKRGNRTERFFDLIVDGNTYHPNIESNIRNPQATFDYVSKDGDTLDHGEPETHIGSKTTSKELWQAALKATTKDEYLEAVQAASARDFIIFNDKVESFAEKKFAPPLPLFEPMQNFNIDGFPQLRQFADQLTDVSIRGIACGAQAPPPPPVTGGSCSGICDIVINTFFFISLSHRKFHLDNAARALSLSAAAELARLSGPDPSASTATSTPTSTSTPTTLKRTMQFSMTSPTGEPLPNTNLGWDVNMNSPSQTNTDTKEESSGVDLASLLQMIDPSLMTMLG